MDREKVIFLLSRFGLDITEFEFEPYGDGLINRTYLISTSDFDYVLQRINTVVFNEVEVLQQNAEQALIQLRDDNYYELFYFKTTNGESLLMLSDQYWRLMPFVKDSVSYNICPSEAIALEAGKLLGTFHKSLQHERIEDYKETIPGFHDLSIRTQEFNGAMDYADHLTMMEASDEINFAFSTLPEFKNFYEAGLPLRVCHNDTKFNNFLFDSSEKGLCLIDLDTIMPGYFHYDFGDAVRTIVNPAKEDERDMSKICLNRDYFKAFVHGIRDSNLKLTKVELEFLPLSVALMPFINGLRALTDYLNGNIYYKVTYPKQNLDRCRSLFKFTRIALAEQDYISRTLSILK